MISITLGLLTVIGATFRSLPFRTAPPISDADRGILHGAGTPLQRGGPARFGSYRLQRCFCIYRPSSLPRFGLGRCDCHHKLGFEYPIIFWTPTEV